MSTIIVDLTINSADILINDPRNSEEPLISEVLDDSGNDKITNGEYKLTLKIRLNREITSMLIKGLTIAEAKHRDDINKIGELFYVNTREIIRDDELHMKWEKVLRNIRRVVMDSSFHVWIKPLVIKWLEGKNTLQLITYSEMSRNIIEFRYRTILEQCIHGVFGSHVNVDIVPDNE